MINPLMVRGGFACGRTPYLGGVFCIVEEGIEAQTTQGSLDVCTKAWSWLKDDWVATMFICRGGGHNGLHGLGGSLESLEACTRSIGHTSWSSLAFGDCLVDKIIFDLNMCALGV